jgi:hypothetical protein
MSQYLPPSEILNNPEFIQIKLKPNGHGGVVVNHITHHTRIPSIDSPFPEEPTWEDVLYFRYIGKHTPDESPKNRMGGYVYVLTNIHYPGKCKIGMTTNLPEKRLQQINGAGVVDNWELDYFYKCARPYDFEQALHAKLSNIRFRNDREFFDIEVNEAIKLVEQMGDMFGPL